jgi:hypothetical protein
MGWGLLVSQRRLAGFFVSFYCDTSDQAFGPLLRVNGLRAETVRGEFDTYWKQACIRMNVGYDPRTHDMNELYLTAYLTFVMSGIDRNFTEEEWRELAHMTEVEQ